MVNLPEPTPMTVRAVDLASDSPRRRMVIYCRISDDREGRQNGVERQEKQCRALAARNGDEIVRVFVDDDRSAYSGKRRPDYLEMLAFLQAGLADGAYALAPTRFYRRLDDGLEFFRLINQGSLYVETVKQGRYDLSTADGRRDALRAAVDAQHESEQIGERVRDAKAENLARGEYRGGPRPFGFEPDGVTLRSLQCPACPGTDGYDADRACVACRARALTVPQSEAWHIERGIDAIIAGESVRAVTAAANDAGARTPARRFKQEDGSKGEPESREWRPEDFRRMLLRPRNAGLIDHSGEIVGRAQWPAVVPEEKWRAAKAILEDPGRRTTTGNARVWLGSGVFRCWCGSTVRASTAGSGRVKAYEHKGTRPVYRCRASTAHVTRDAPALDSYVQDLAIERLSRADAVELLLPAPAAQDTAEDLAAQANTLRAKLDGITADYNEDRITRKQMLEMTEFTRARLDKLTARMAARASGSVLASLPLATPQIAEQWPGYHLDKRRAIIDALMSVTIHRARRGRPVGFKAGSKDGYFDPSAVEIDWKSPS